MTRLPNCKVYPLRARKGAPERSDEAALEIEAPTLNW